MFNSCESDFNIERHIIPFLQDNAFYAEISRHMRKSSTMSIPTAAVSYDPKSDEISLWYNPEFMKTLSNLQIRGVLLHEFNHLVFGHLAARRKNPPKMWNIATDLAINSLIVEQAQTTRGGDPMLGDNSILPSFVLLPGRWPVTPEGRELTKEEKDAAPVAKLIASFPKLKASEWYYGKLQELSQQLKSKGKGGEGGGDPFGDYDSFDDHASWDELTDEQREYVEGKVKAIVEKAVRNADSSASGWGNIPADVREEIRRSVSTQIDWRQVLRQFVGSIVRGSRTTSIKRINRRYPYVHPGTKRGYVAKLLIAIDQSGSVDDGMLSDFFAELGSLTKKVDVSILPFDCSADVKDVYEWKKGQRPAAKRTKSGGTDFSAPTNVFNDAKNRGRWDGMLIMTDGQAPMPGPSRQKRGWILGKGTTLYFDSKELQIFITDERKMTGAWR